MKMSFPLHLPTAIVGMGLTGRSVLNLLVGAGVPREQILTFDSKDPSSEFKDETALLSHQPKSLIVSPGVPLALAWIQNFKKNGGQITSELEIAYSFLKNEKVVTITGSVGKSTCAALLRAGLNKFSKTAFVGGNLGFPLADYALGLLHGSARADWVVLELSSYQLENFSNLKSDATLITSLNPNHLERYKSLEEYYETKWTLVAKTKGPIVLNQHGGDLSKFASKKRGSWIWSSSMSPEFVSFPFHQAQLVGHHNYDNLALVIRLARELQWPDVAIQGFLEFSGLLHRLENMGVLHGVRFINDSKATTIDSVLQAIRSTENLASGRSHILIGGRDKNLPWQNLAQAAAAKRTFYFFGECRDKAKSLSGLPGDQFSNLAEALTAVLTRAQGGDLVLLSPGGTSLDEFTSFEERGAFFKNQISRYAGSPNQ